MANLKCRECGCAWTKQNMSRTRIGYCVICRPDKADQGSRSFDTVIKSGPYKGLTEADRYTIERRYLEKLAETKKWRVECSHLCSICCEDVIKLKENYTVHDEVWLQAAPFKFNFILCIRCLEEQLGRKLVPADFKGHLYPIYTMYGQSPRLLNRLGMAATESEVGQEFLDSLRGD
jgi:hypothetical protein